MYVCMYVCMYVRMYQCMHLLLVTITGSQHLGLNGELSNAHHLFALSRHECRDLCAGNELVRVVKSL